MKCPCEDCLCVPVCRHKNYFALFLGCCLIDKYVKKPNDGTNHYTIKITQKILKPTLWKASGKGSMTITLGEKL